MARRRKIAADFIISAAALACAFSTFLWTTPSFGGIILESTPEIQTIGPAENTEKPQETENTQIVPNSPIFETSVTESSEEAEQSKIYLDADNLSYGEAEGMAIAEGNVKIRNKDAVLSAPYAEFDSQTNTVDAYSDYRENVVINSAAGTLTGRHLKYNMDTGRGVLTQASGKVEELYVHGDTVKVMPAEDAVKEGLIKDKKNSKDKDKKNKKVAEWREVTSTTCDFTKPHYRLVSKKIIVYPGNKTVIKQPKLYIGDKMIMKYPLDFIISGKKQEGRLIPIIRYDSKKGVGVGLRGPIDFEDLGKLNIAGAYWTHDIWEMMAEYKYTVTKGLEVFGKVDRTYNSDALFGENDTLWRPSWGLTYENNGWNTKLWWTQREKVGNEIFPDYNIDYDVWRDPEFSASTPWFKENLTNGAIRFFGLWGRYCDNTHPDFVERLAYGAEYKAQPKWNLGVFKPFYGGRYTEYKYYENGTTSQQVTNAWVGFDYNLGRFEMQTAFSWQWGDAGSPMSWDDYGDKKILYQKISFLMPFGSSWEKWKLSLRGKYDVGRDKFSSLKCVLTYDRHCMTWELWYGENFAKDESKIGLTFYLDAYPEYKIGVGEEQTTDKNQYYSDFN